MKRRAGPNQRSRKRNTADSDSSSACSSDSDFEPTPKSKSSEPNGKTKRRSTTDKMSNQARDDDPTVVPKNNHHVPFSSVNNGVSKQLVASPSTKLGGDAKSGKKLTIQNAKAKPTQLDDLFQQFYDKLWAAIRAIHQRMRIGYSLEELYSATENLCSYRQAATVYSELRKLCDDHIRAQLAPLLQEVTSNDDFLAALEACWQQHCETMLMIRSIVLYLDRTYVMQNQDIESIWDLGLSLFRKNIVEQPSVRQRMVDSVLELIERDRNGDVVDRSRVKNVVRMMLDLRVYAEAFEPAFLRRTEEYYRAEALSRTAECALPVYAAHVAQRLTEEEARVAHYLDECTRVPLLTACRRQLLEAHVGTLLAKGLDQLLDARRLDDLALLYNLLSSVRPPSFELNAADELAAHFGAYLKRAGRELVTNRDSNAEKDTRMVPGLLELKEAADQFIARCFGKAERFVAAVRDAFESCVNERPNKPAEMLAKYVDGRLRAGNREQTEDELDRLLDRVMILFRFVHGRDVFEAFYKKDLAKRLLVGKSASADAEKAMLSKLKQECGAQFTLKLEGMFRDVELSRDISLQFKQHLQAQTELRQVEMTVNVLTQGYWPTYPTVELKLPAELLAYQEVFKSYYLRQHHGRKLLFQPTLDHCVLRAVFEPSDSSTRKELEVSLIQALVLLLYNDHDQLRYSEIREAMLYRNADSQTPSQKAGTSESAKRPWPESAENELIRTMQSLALGKARVLTKEPRTKEVLDDDVFTFNSAFRDKHVRIRINQVQLTETKDEQAATHERVFADRQYQIDAAIVRIMKTRKTLAHNVLVAELLQQLKFPVKPPDLKKRIESLLERDYIERDKENSNMYHYVA